MSLSEVIIESAQPEDAEAILQIRRAAWLGTYPNEKFGITKQMIADRFDQLSHTEALARWQKGISTEGQNRVTYVARIDDRVVGFVVCRVSKNGLRRIGAMYVSPLLQGQGIGGQLMRQAIEWFGRDDDIYLDVVSYNQRAINFYKHFGFEETGRQVEDAVKPFADGTHIPEIEMILPAQ